jgi:hypothetical protein
MNSGLAKQQGVGLQSQIIHIAIMLHSSRSLKACVRRALLPAGA